MAVIMNRVDEGFVDLENGDYRSLTNWISNSELGLIAKAPIYYKRQVIDGIRDAPSANMKLGTAVHAAVLEPELFTSDYARLPDGDYRFKAAKEERAKLEAESPAKYFLSPREYDRVLEIQDAVMASKTASRYLSGCKMEQSFFWKDRVTGVQCKARADALNLGEGYVADLKTTGDIHEFSSSMAKFAYHRQAAFYLDGLSALTGERFDRWIWIVVQAEAPHLVDVCEAHRDDLKIGRIEYQKHLGVYAHCRETNVWPGLPDVLTTRRLPEYYRNKFRESFVKLD